MAITDPRDISGLVAWYSAQSITGLSNGATMTTWSDLSGNGNHATVAAGAPKYRTTDGPGGIPCVHLDSGSFSLPAGATSMMGSAGEILLSFWDANFIGGAVIDFGTASDENLFSYAGDIYDDFGSTSRRNFGGVSTSTWYRYAAMSKAGVFKSWLSGTAKLNTASNTVAWRNPMQIGGTSGSYRSIARTTYLVFYNRELTSGEHADLDAWAVANPGGGTTVAGPTTITGTLATETDAVQAGSSKVGKILTGTLATEADSAMVGGSLVGKVITGTLATETDAALAGDTSSATLVPGTLAVESDSVLGGSVVVGSVVAGTLAAETNAALAGQILTGQVVIGTLAIETDAALAGVVVGPVVHESDPGRDSARTRDGYGIATWTPPIVSVPIVASQHTVVVAQAFGAVTMQGNQPVYSISQAHTPRATTRILLGGVDITFWRGCLTPPPSYNLVSPLLYGPADLELPQIPACFTGIGTGELAFMGIGKELLVQRVLDGVVVGTDYKGIVDGYGVSGRNLVVQIGGEVQGRADQRDRQVPLFPRVNDLGRQIADAITDLGIPFNPPLGPVTGIEVMTTGGVGHIEHIQERVTMAHTRAGKQWTVMPDPETGVYELHRKDTTTIHGTVFADDARTVLDVHRDISEEPNRIFISGVNRWGQRIRFAVYPGLVQGEAPDFPGHMEEGDTGEGVRLLIGRLQGTGYLKLEDAAGGYDADVVQAVTDLQIDAGLFDEGFVGTAVPGEVNLVTWEALYDLNVTGLSLEWAHIEPAAQRRKVRPWNRSASGTIIGINEGYEPDHLVRDRTVALPAGFNTSQMREFSRTLLHDSNAPNWTGTVTFHTGAMIRGDGFQGMTVTEGDVMDAREVLPGWNLDFPQFDGGTLFHVSAVQVDQSGLVVATIDTRFRDSMEAWDVQARNKESRNDPSRAKSRKHRSSTLVKDSIGEWDAVAGRVSNDVNLQPGWNIIKTVGAREGTISQIRLQLTDAAEFAVAVFGKEITAEKLNNLIPAPLTQAGERAWRRKESRAELKQHGIIYSAGIEDEPCGYGVDLKSDDGELTGEHEDEGQWAYRSPDYWLYVAVWVEEENQIPIQRIMWNQLESAV